MWIGHQDRISHIQMSPDGMALCTSSWDGTLAVSSNKVVCGHIFIIYCMIRYGHEFITWSSS